MITYSFYESDTRVMRYAETLARRGDRVDVISLKREGQSPTDVVDGVNVCRVQTRTLDAHGKFFYIVRILAFFIRSMRLVSWKHLICPYQLIHIHSVPDFLVFAAWLPRMMGAKIILDVHDLLPEFYASKYSVPRNSWSFKALVLIERASCAFAHHVIAANDLWQERLISRAVPSEKCSSMVNVPDQAVFCRRARTRSDSKFIFLYPGTLNWHQGVDIAIRAFARVAREVPAAEFHIYGEGPYEALLRRLVQDLELQDRVKLNGFIASREVARVIENADVGVVPKRKDGFGDEAFSTKIMEFMALGVPVIVPDTRIDRHYFTNSTVRFFQGGDEGDLAQAMVCLIRRPDLRNQLAGNALQFVAKNNWDLMKVEYLALVDSLTLNACRVASAVMPDLSAARNTTSQRG
jgi:glycosyltransferase involved in cell wall biosynthesis